VSRAGLTAKLSLAALNFFCVGCLVLVGSRNLSEGYPWFGVADLGLAALLFSTTLLTFPAGRTALAATDADRKERE
jgi:hypothetical protein